jgi:hypothetical protein
MSPSSTTTITSSSSSSSSAAAATTTALPSSPVASFSSSAAEKNVETMEMVSSASGSMENIENQKAPANVFVEMQQEQNENIHEKQKKIDAQEEDKLQKSPAFSHKKIKRKKRSRVVFETAEIVEFEPTVFTTTVTSGGVPVSPFFSDACVSCRLFYS